MQRQQGPSAETLPRAASGPVQLLIGTRKGAFILTSDADRARWTMSDPILLGNIVYHLVSDPRKPERMLLSGKAGHLGPTLYRSEDGGQSFQEVPHPPAFPKAEGDGSRRTVDHTFWLTPGHASQPDVWYAGTSPKALFRSEDGGLSWSSVSGFNDHPQYDAWTGSGQDGTPDGPKLHSILVDPRDPDHLYLGMSGGGVFESTDGGRDWKPLNQGCALDFLPPPPPEFGHDPHCVALHSLQPDRLYQQNHCGIYRMDRPEGRWVRIGDNMPRDVGDIGFPIALHPRDINSIWVFPMDGTDVWPRTSPGGRPAVYRSRDAGESWQRLDRGLPRSHAYLTVKRQAMAVDTHDPVGVYFGSTSGEVWGSVDEGDTWTSLARHLPHIYAIEARAL